VTDRPSAPRERADILDQPGSILGKVVAHYRILEHIGGGGMGVVFRALDTKLEREVALKFLPPEIRHLKEAKERFIQEARAASALDHPNICTIYEIGETRDGQLFLAMAYSDGETLKRRIERGPLSVAETVGIARQIAGGLAASHACDIIHRDVKPSNVWLSRVPAAGRGDGVPRVRILDFGLAKVLGQSDLTRSGSSMGTPAYMSPEHARGLRVDPRTDLWSLGVLIYEALAGAAPFTGPNIPAVMYALLSTEPRPLSELRPDVPEELERVVSRLLRKEADERYPSCRELLLDLEQVPVPEAMSASAGGEPADRPPADEAAAARTAPMPGLAPEMDETPLSGTPSVATPSVATPRREPAESGPEGQDFDRLIEKGLGAAFARDYRGAAAAFEEALRLRPGDSRARFNLQRVRGFLVERG
jgi:serine/threonine protein kinase